MLSMRCSQSRLATGPAISAWTTAEGWEGSTGKTGQLRGNLHRTEATGTSEHSPAERLPLGSSDPHWHCPPQLDFIITNSAGAQSQCFLDG